VFSNIPIKKGAVIESAPLLIGSAEDYELLSGTTSGFWHIDRAASSIDLIRFSLEYFSKSYFKIKYSCA